VALVEHGCIDLLVEAMREHDYDSELQTQALGAMQSLAENGTWYCMTPAVVCVQHVVFPLLCASVCRHVVSYCWY
jgi:hypothetical protein